jgi:hypothetical protein
MVTKKLPFQDKSEIMEKCIPELPKINVEYYNLLEKYIRIEKRK